jgi:hypothetical protein
MRNEESGYFMVMLLAASKVMSMANAAPLSLNASSLQHGNSTGDRTVGYDIAIIIGTMVGSVVLFSFVVYFLSIAIHACVADCQVRFKLKRVRRRAAAAANPESLAGGADSGKGTY